MNLLGKIIIPHQLICYLMFAKRSIIFSIKRLTMLPSYIVRPGRVVPAHWFAVIFSIVAELPIQMKHDSTTPRKDSIRPNLEWHNPHKFDILSTSTKSSRIQTILHNSRRWHQFNSLGNSNSNFEDHPRKYREIVVNHI